ncbi:MAG: M48 family metallopeptidase [Mariprofundaceae bacterium]
MDFFEHKIDAKRNTYYLYLLFALAIFVINIAVYIAASASLYLSPLFFADIPAPNEFWTIPRFITVSLLTSGIILGGSFYKIQKLKKGGGSAIAKMLGGQRLRKSQDPIERQLINVVEEMAIASGILTPAVYIMEQKSINAFAAGYGQRDTVISITRGAIEMLGRDELQGVIAHEFSHILHGDTQLKMRMMGLLHGITMISDLGILMITGHYSSQYSVHKRASHPLLMLSGILFFSIGLMGMLAADFIKAALSRQREYLADASAVQFTRNPAGIANALKIIGGYKAGSRLRIPQAQQISHLFFGEALQVWWQSNWWASHPPLLARIQRIEPNFRGKIHHIDENKLRVQNQQSAISQFSPSPKLEQLQLNVDQVMQSIGTLNHNNLLQAQHLLKQIPKALYDQITDPITARAILYKLLLHNKKSILSKQLELISKIVSSSQLSEVLRIHQIIPNIKVELRLPLLDLLSPQLNQLEQQEKITIISVLKALMTAKQDVGLFEYLSYQHLLYSFGLKTKVQYSQSIKIARFEHEVVILLSMLCSISQHEKSKTIFQEAALLIYPSAHLKTIKQVDLHDVFRALKKLNLCSFNDKKNLLQAIVFCVLSDGKVSSEELETVRLISISLDCPMPALSSGS